MVAAKNQPLIVIVGETATGKSELAIYLAKRFKGEIISADSWTVYRGFDIGTAKPNLKDQALVKHHLLDIADPNEGFSAAVFKRQVTSAIEKISSENKVPILSGGSGLYVDSVLYDYSFMPAGSPELRRQYNSMSLDELLELIKKLGYNTTGIDLNNKRRVIRLLENQGVRPQSKPLRSNTLILGIALDQSSLSSKIEKRVDAMLRAGLEAEVKQLSEAYGWGIEPMKGIGYREFKDYFEGTKSQAETRQKIITDSIKLAKKQRTWFKRNNSIQWIDNKSDVVAMVTTYLNKLK